MSGELTDWQPIETAPENQVVRTKIHDEHGKRSEQLLIRQKRLWFVPNGSMYVYFTPTHWAPASLSPQEDKL